MICARGPDTFVHVAFNQSHNVVVGFRPALYMNQLATVQAMIVVIVVKLLT